MSKALYNKYRPKTFSEVVDQNHIKITLQNEIESGRIAQAYLFAGPRGIGKTTIARIFAKAINCQKRKNGEPCCSCEYCLSIQEGRSFDLIEIDAASNRGINEIRELREHVKYPPTLLQYKVFIIDEAHMLTIEAFNALLKTLEEPPKHTIFILATTEIHKLPETIISRCQRFDFKKVKIDDIVKLLQLIMAKEKVKVAAGVLENIARHSEGYVRDAVGILGQILSLNNKEITAAEAALVLPHSDFNLVRELVGYLIKKDLKNAIDLINRLINEGIEIENFTNDLLDYLRKLLLVKVMGDAESLSWELDKNFVQVINEQATALPIDQLLKIIDLLMTKIPNYKYTKIIQLPLEIFAAEVVMLLDKDNLISNPQFENNLNKRIAEKPHQESHNQADKEISSSNITLEKFGRFCPKIFEELKNCNHALSVFMKSSKPISLINNILTLAVQYKFQQEKLAELKSRRSLEEAIEKVCSYPIKVEVTMDKEFLNRAGWDNYQKNLKEDNGDIDQLAAEFGGQVIE